MLRILLLSRLYCRTTSDSSDEVAEAAGVDVDDDEEEADADDLSILGRLMTSSSFSVSLWFSTLCGVVLPLNTGDVAAAVAPETDPDNLLLFPFMLR